MLHTCALSCVLGVILLNLSHGFAFGDEIYNWEEKNE